MVLSRIFGEYREFDIIINVPKRKKREFDIFQSFFSSSQVHVLIILL